MNSGRLTGGDLDRDKARDELGPLERELESLPAPFTQPPPPFPSIDAHLPGPGGETDVDAQLQVYLDRATAPKPKGFPPLQALSARLNEFAAPLHYEEALHESKEAVRQQPRSSLDSHRRSDLEWFEEKFHELKGLVARQPDRSEIASINAKLAEIIGRVDRLSAAMPGEKTMAAVETQLAELSRSLETTRAQSSSDASRIARAAKEILAATERAEEVRAGFENAARHTVKELGQTVAVAASRAAAVTAEQITKAFHHSGDGGRLARVESELRALNAFSRESTDRTTAALEQVHETLRVFLEKDRFAAPRKRAGVHTPITANAPAYTIPGADFGSEPVGKPRLDTITLRTPPPPDPNLIEALKQAGEKIVVSKSSSSRQHVAENERSPQSHAFPAGPLFRDEEKSLPLLGLGIVAFILLIASAALYYLHTKTKLPPFHLTVLPDIQAARIVPNPAPHPPALYAREAEPGKPQPAAPKGGPALFTAADQSPASSPSQPDAGEDLQALTNAASHGDREAQFRIAARFLNDGTQQGDPASAARWLARAADQGHTESQFVLASLYERGAGVPKDEILARDLYRRAASAGHIRAMHNLAVLLAAQDTPEDYQEAAGWFASAAMSGLTDSQFNLAVLYERGLGLQQNNQKAFFWYQVASLAGDKEATRHAERLKRSLSEAETQAAAEQAGSWRPSVEQLPHLASGSPARG